jgi:dTDP-4-dehydrorhamnose reductase
MSYLPKLLITGASGLLGLNMALQVQGRYTVTGTANQHPLNGTPFEIINVDLAQIGEAHQVIEQVKPDLIINCAALANVEECERQPDLARQLNTCLPAELAEAAARRSLPFIHISTDAVFDGLRGNYSESDIPAPINTYARTKLAGEQAVLKAYPHAIIARVNFYGWSLNGQRSLAEMFVRNLSAGKRMFGFHDVFFCPLLVNDLVELLLKMVMKDLSGLYHVVGSECVSKYHFGLAVADEFKLDPALIVPVSWTDGGLQVVRSPNLSLNIDHLTRSLGTASKGVAEGLKSFHRLLMEDYPKKLYSYASMSGS